MQKSPHVVPLGYLHITQENIVIIDNRGANQLTALQHQQQHSQLASETEVFSWDIFDGHSESCSILFGLLSSPEHIYENTTG